LAVLVDFAVDLISTVKKFSVDFDQDFQDFRIFKMVIAEILNV